MRGGNDRDFRSITQVAQKLNASGHRRRRARDVAPGAPRRRESRTLESDTAGFVARRSGRCLLEVLLCHGFGAASSDAGGAVAGEQSRQRGRCRRREWCSPSGCGSPVRARRQCRDGRIARARLTTTFDAAFGLALRKWRSSSQPQVLVWLRRSSASTARLIGRPPARPTGHTASCPQAITSSRHRPTPTR